MDCSVFSTLVIVAAPLYSSYEHGPPTLVSGLTEWGWTEWRQAEKVINALKMKKKAMSNFFIMSLETPTCSFFCGAA